MSGTAEIPAEVAQWKLTPVDDGVRQYTILADGAEVGEIRPLNLHAAALYLGRRSLLLRDDQAAAAVAAGGGLWQVFLQKLQLSGQWSLHEEDREIARVARHWHPSRDQLELCAGGETWQMPLCGAGRGLSLLREDSVAGAANAGGLLQGGIHLHAPGLPAAPAVLLMYVLQHCQSA